jgi:hypothetical protein
MSDYNEETTFLRRILLYDPSSKSKRVEELIDRVHRDRACIRQATELSAVSILLVVVLSQTKFFQSEPTVRLWALSVIGITAVICLMMFLCLLVLYRAKLNRLRNECRGLIRNLIETRLILPEQLLPARAVIWTQSSNGDPSLPKGSSSESSELSRDPSILIRLPAKRKNRK